MSEILKVANAIIQRVSSWLGCARCFMQDDPSEQIVVHEEMCNKKINGIDNDKDEEYINIHEAPKFVIFPWPLDENTENSIATLLGNSQLSKIEVDDRSNIKAPIKPRKPPRKKTTANEHISADNTCSTNHHNKLNDCSCNITDRQITCSSEKVKIPAVIVTTAGSSDYLLTSSKSQNISRQFLIPSTRSLHKKSQTSFCSQEPRKKDILTSTKINSGTDIKKSLFRIRLRKFVPLYFLRTPKEERNMSKNKKKNI